MTAQENRTGPLKTDDDFLKALRGLVQDFNSLVKQYNKFVAAPISFLQIVKSPTTLSGYGIVDAAPLVHRHNASDIDGLPAASTGIVAWSAITGKPYTIDGFGIIDASRIGHRHHWTDILDPPSVMSPAAHTHPESDIVGLVADLGTLTAAIAALLTDPRFTDARVPLPHIHDEGDVTGLVNDLAIRRPMTLFNPPNGYVPTEAPPSFLVGV